MMVSPRLFALALAVLAGLGVGPAAAAPAGYQARAPQDEVIYFILPDRFENGDRGNDRGGLRGPRLRTGYDPTHKGYFHGGDLKGVTARLDYIQGLGVTAIWLGPIFRNKPVQGAPGQETAGYHGYWITDFTDVDPHFGSKADLKILVDAAHARGMKVYLDIVTNHTADVIAYRECPQADCPYRELAAYPYSRRGGIDGQPVNDGFAGDGPVGQTVANFARLTRPDYAYTPFIRPGEEGVKKPDWLNDPRWYHNRGDSTWVGESTTYGDFAGLDDLFTESPRVLQGFIDIYGGWIDQFGIDGFRIDTAKHVNQEFWRAFVPAMRERARRRGIPDFFVFGEYYDLDPASLAAATRVTGLPAVLDFAFQSAAATALAGSGGSEGLARLFALDVLYEGGAATARTLPTFLGNHDMGRFAYQVRKGNPGASEDELFRRVLLGHALMMFARGTPVIYYGDEQGFSGDGGDQDAREDMFASRVASYNDNRLIGSLATTARSSFRTDTALYVAIAAMSAIRASEPALRSGDMTVRAFGDHPGLFAFSRRLPGGAETLVVLNSSTEVIKARLPVEPGSDHWRGVHGDCATRSQAPGSYAVEIRPLEYLICAATVAGEPH